MYVIALKGPSDKGKSTTLNIVYQLLLFDGYKQVENYPSKFKFEVLGNPANKDFIDILEKNSKLVGFATMGDYGEPSPDSVKKLLQKLFDAGCTTVVCAISDKINIAEIQNYPHIIIQKTTETADAKQRIANSKDAQAIFKTI